MNGHFRLGKSLLPQPKALRNIGSGALCEGSFQRLELAIINSVLYQEMSVSCYKAGRRKGGPSRSSCGSTAKVLPYNYGGKLMRRRRDWKRGSGRRGSTNGSTLSTARVKSRSAYAFSSDAIALSYSRSPVYNYAKRYPDTGSLPAHLWSWTRTFSPYATGGDLKFGATRELTIDKVTSLWQIGE